MNRRIATIALAIVMLAACVQPATAQIARGTPRGDLAARPVNGAGLVQYTATDCIDSACSAGGGSTWVTFRWNGSAWEIPSGSGASTFDELGSGTNTSAVLQIGSGAALAPTGSGVIVATDLTPDAIDATTDLAVGLCTDGQALVKAGGAWTCGTASGATNLGTTVAADQVTVTNDTGSDAVLPEATSTTAGVLGATSAEHLGHMVSATKWADPSGLPDETDVLAAINAACNQTTGERFDSCVQSAVPPGLYLLANTLEITGDGSAPDAVNEGAWTTNLVAASRGYIQTPDTPTAPNPRCAVTFQWNGASGGTMVRLHGARASSIEGFCFIMESPGGNFARTAIMLTADVTGSESSTDVLISNVEIHGLADSWAGRAAQIPTYGIMLRPADYATSCADAAGTPPCTTDAQIDRVVIRDSRILAHYCYSGDNGFTNGVRLENSECAYVRAGYEIADTDFTLEGGYANTVSKGENQTGDQATVCALADAAVVVGNTGSQQPKKIHVEDFVSEADCGIGWREVAPTNPADNRRDQTTITNSVFGVGGNSQTTVAIFRNWGTLDITGSTFGARYSEVFEDGEIQLLPPDGGRLHDRVNVLGESTEIVRNQNAVPVHGIVGVKSREAPPHGGNFKLNSASSTWPNPQNSIAGMMLSPGSTTQPSTMCDEVLPATPHPDLVGHTPQSISSSVGCSYSTNLGGYDSHLNNAASAIVNSQHAFVDAGLAIDHITLIAAHSSFTTGDCMNASIIAATLSQIRCNLTASGFSNNNSIQGGTGHKMDFRGLALGSDALNNSIQGGSGNSIIGASVGGLIQGGQNNAIVMHADQAAGRFAYGAKVSGTGSKVFSADRGDGTIVFPWLAEAHGLGGRSWLSGMKCTGGQSFAGEGPTVPGADGEGTSFAEIQYCEMHLGNFDVAAGSSELLYLNRPSQPSWADNQRYFAIEDQVLALSGKVVCTDRELGTHGGLTHPFQATFRVDETITIRSGASGDAAILDGAGGFDADDAVALELIGDYSNSGAWNTYTAELQARDGTASLLPGFDIEITNTAGGSNAGGVDCQAWIGVTMRTELP